MTAAPNADGPAPRSRWRAWFWPESVAVSRVEKLRMAMGALLGIGVTAFASHGLGVTAPLHWIVASMGASAVLVFCLPGSPLAQPWSVVAGHLASALVGVACARLMPDPDVAAAAAVALAITAMFALRCLHPPGGATALLLAAAGVGDLRAVLLPVLANALLLTASGWAFHRLTGHRWPQPGAAVPPRAVTDEALDAVLARWNQVLDIGRDELRELVERTQRLAHERRLAHTRCADVMTREVATVEYGTPLQEAWALLRRKGIKTLPVLDRGRHVVGIVTLADFLDAAGLDAHHGFDARLRRFMAATPATHSGKPEVVGQIMTRRVRVTRPQRTLSDLVALFESTGHRHIPVVHEDGKLAGLVTQSDVLAALKAVDRIDGASA